MTGTRRVGVVGIACALALAACAPTVDGPADHQRAVDRADGDHLAAQLAALPGAVSAQVTLRRSVRDLLGTESPTAASAAVLVIVDDAADRAAVTLWARTLTHATAPEIPDADTAVIVEIGAHRPTLAEVGPFTVEAGSRTPLLAALALGLLAILGLAAWIVWRERQRS